jgi:hypothetical protein
MRRAVDQWSRVPMLALLPLLLLGGGCTEDPIDVEGMYTIALTNRENGCNFNDWVEGETTTGVQVTVTQSGGSATAVVGGAAGTWFDVSLGSREYSGSVSGDHVNLTLYGTRSATAAGCTWTLNSILTGTLIGDTLTGDIRYTPSTNGSPDCATIEDCVSRQQYNGVRAPR